MQNDKLSKLIKRIKRRNLTTNLLLYPVLLLSIIGITINTIDEIYMSDIGEFILLILGLLFTFIVLILMIPECIDYLRDGLIESVKNKLNEEELRYVEEATKPQKWEVEYWRQKICSFIFKNKKTNKTTQESNAKSNNTLWIVGLILLIGIINGIMDDTDYSTTRTSPQVQPTQTETPKAEVKQNQPKQDLTWFAEYACEKEIKARAVYPPSVKVHFRRDNYIKGNSYTVYGTVDSQNGFGAMVRHNFACEAIIDEANDKYWVNDLNIE